MAIVVKRLIPFLNSARVVRSFRLFERCRVLRAGKANFFICLQGKVNYTAVKLDGIFYLKN